MEAKEYNIYSLLSEFSLVFPRIQRDYAQGRMTYKASQVRSAILKSLHEALDKDEAEVNLDFVYGVQKKGIVDGDKTFSPLDGQQRLTTLFLLYWFLSFKTNHLDDFRQHLSKQQGVKFLYETRDSAREFCKCMISSNVDSANEKKSISWNIKNQSWFLAMWIEDPTVQGMLTMLDAMDEEFNKQPNLGGDDASPHRTRCYDSYYVSYYDKLTRKKAGFIRFYILPFEENYTLGDDLYVKMNARGLALTTFENFKSSFEEEMFEGSEDKKAFVNNIDTLWTDMFWYPLIPKNGNPPSKVDDEMMRFVRLLLSFQYAQRKDEGDANEQDNVFNEKVFGGLRVNSSGKFFIPDEEQNYAYLTSKGVLDKESSKFIVEGFKKIGNLWDKDNKEWKDKDLKPIDWEKVWIKFCQKPDYECQLLILSIIIAPDNEKELWYRLCRNLICNTIINDQKDFRWLISKLYELKDQENFGL